LIKRQVCYFYLWLFSLVTAVNSKIRDAPIIGISLLLAVLQIIKRNCKTLIIVANTGSVLIRLKFCPTLKNSLQFTLWLHLKLIAHGRL